MPTHILTVKCSKNVVFEQLIIIRLTQRNKILTFIDLLVRVYKFKMYY